MNIIISGFVGALVATAVTVGGINAVANKDTKPVAQSELYTYSSR
jgi:hypothetical protein